MAIANIRYVKICITVLAWIVVLSAANHRSDPPAVLGRYSWDYAYLLGLLVSVAVTLSLVKSSWYLKLYQAKTGILVSAVSLLVSMGIVEVVLRLVDPLGISYYELAGNYVRDKLADDQLIFRHKPSWETRYGDVRVTYNERGLRDRPILPKGEDEYRVLALGDSVTFGWGVDQEKTFVARLEPLLQGRLHRPVRVINSGVAHLAHLEGSGQEGTADRPLRLLQTGRGLRRRLPSPCRSRDSVASRLSSSAVSARI